MKTQRVVNNQGTNEKRVLLIEEYYNQCGSTMPFKEFETICKTPFLHMRKNLAEDKLYEVRFKYLGKFTPVPSTVVWRMKHNLKRYKESLITKEHYDRIIASSIEYIKLAPTKFERFGEELKQFIK